MAGLKKQGGRNETPRPPYPFQEDPVTRTDGEIKPQQQIRALIEIKNAGS
jgi:hypothetical protein